MPEKGRGSLARYCCVIMASRSGEEASSFDGRRAHFLGYENQVDLWMRTARAEVYARPPFSVSHVQPVPREVCLGGGSDISDHSGGVAKILNILRNCFAPEALDKIHQQGM